MNTILYNYIAQKWRTLTNDDHKWLAILQSFSLLLLMFLLRMKPIINFKVLLSKFPFVKIFPRQTFVLYSNEIMFITTRQIFILMQISNLYSKKFYANTLGYSIFLINKLYPLIEAI